MRNVVTILSADIFANSTNSTGENAVIIDITPDNGDLGRQVSFPKSALLISDDQSPATHSTTL